MAVFFSLALLILGYTVANCRLCGKGSTGIVNILVLVTVAAQATYIIDLLVLEEGVDGQFIVALEILGNICDIINTCCLEFAYVIRLEAILLNNGANLISKALWIYPVIYPIADMLSIVGYFDENLGSISPLVWNITNIGLILQEMVVHAIFYREISKVISVKQYTTSLWITVSTQFVYMVGFLLSLIFAIVYEDPTSTELIYLFWSINIALIQPLAKELFMARDVQTKTKFTDHRPSLSHKDSDLRQSVNQKPHCK
ncbi:hypothetical protein HDV06_004503 [Boothiomyces sp. JEL0866]|nr:hypothetical protein HDV06_004503 [Boothiomyces sp. JEL0866]